MTKIFQCIMTILSVIVVMLLFLGIAIYLVDTIRNLSSEDSRFTTDYPVTIELEEDQEPENA